MTDDIGKQNVDPEFPKGNPSFRGAVPPTPAGAEEHRQRFPERKRAKARSQRRAGFAGARYVRPSAPWEGVAVAYTEADLIAARRAGNLAKVLVIMNSLSAPPVAKKMSREDVRAKLDSLPKSTRDAMEDALLDIAKERGEYETAAELTAGFTDDGAYVAPDPDEEIEW